MNDDEGDKRPSQAARSRSRVGDEDGPQHSATTTRSSAAASAIQADTSWETLLAEVGQDRAGAGLGIVVHAL